MKPTLTAFLLAAILFPVAALAQDTPPAAPASAPRLDRSCNASNTCQTETIYLTSVGTQSDANEILVALRNILPPWIKVFLVSSNNAIVLQASASELALAHKIIHDLDRPKKTYRVTYTLTDFDGDKRVGSQHFTLVLDEGQRTTVKQGSKVPVATGNYDEKNTSRGIQTQFTYLDVGMNIDTTLTVYAGGVRLRHKIEQSSVAPEPANIAGVNEPIIRQTVIDGFSDVTPGKPLILGSVDIVGSTHHLDIAASVEVAP